MILSDSAPTYLRSLNEIMLCITIPVNMSINSKLIVFPRIYHRLAKRVSCEPRAR